MSDQDWEDAALDPEPTEDEDAEQEDQGDDYDYGDEAEEYADEEPAEEQSQDARAFRESEEAPAQRTYAPPPVTRYRLSDDERARFNEAILSEDPAAVMEATFDRMFAARMREQQVQAVGTDYHVQEFARENPGVYAKYAPQIRAILAEAPEAVLANPKQAEWAVLNALAKQVGEGSLKQTVLEMAALYAEDDGTAGREVPRLQPAREPSAPQKTQKTQQRARPTQGSQPLPPAQRIPSPSSGLGSPTPGQGLAATPRPAPRTEAARGQERGGNRVLTWFLEGQGLTPGRARGAAREMEDF